MNNLPEFSSGDWINFLITWFKVRAGATKPISLAGWSLATSVSVWVCMSWLGHTPGWLPGSIESKYPSLPGMGEWRLREIYWRDCKRPSLELLNSEVPAPKIISPQKIGLFFWAKVQQVTGYWQWPSVFSEEITSHLHSCHSKVDLHLLMISWHIRLKQLLNRLCDVK